MKKLLSFVGGALLFASCQTLDSVSVEQLIPAPVTFPEEVYSVGVVNNVAIPTVKNKIETITEPYERVHIVNENGTLATEELAATLADAQYFSQVLICDSALRKADQRHHTRPLTQSEVQQLTYKMGVDLLVSLEAQQSLYRLTTVYEEGQEDTPLCSYNMQSGIIVNIYIPQRSTKLYQFKATDSLFCVREVWNVDKEMQKDVQTFAGEIAKKYLLPTWTTRDRVYFSGGSPSLNEVNHYLKNQNWDRAYEVWMHYYEQKEKAVDKAKMAFNIALYFEVNGSIEEAEKWLNKAQKYIQTAQKQKNPKYQCIDDYAKQLQQRKEELLQLKMQMKRLER